MKKLNASCPARKVDIQQQGNQYNKEYIVVGSTVKLGMIMLLCVLALRVTHSLAMDWDAVSCTNRGGTIVTGILSGKFCRSNVSMNWWSANAWCQKHGGVLVDLSNACPGVPINNNASCKANLYEYSSELVGGEALHWTKNTAENGGIQAWALLPDSYDTRLSLQSVAERGYALCE